MSAPAIKSPMPGVGQSAASAGHTMMPMNMVAQKVVSSPADQTTGGLKPLQNTSLNYVTLQPPSQPLSLIQEHRAPVYPFANNIPTEQQQQQQLQQQQPQQPHKELEGQQDPNKLVQNGTEQSKVMGLTSFSIFSFVETMVRVCWKLENFTR